MAKVAHTPTPWHVGPHYKSDVQSRQGRVCECSYLNSPRGAADAAFIVKAVNNHDALIAALEQLLDQHVRLVSSGDCGNWNVEDDGEVKAARAALRAASGVPEDGQ